MTTTVIILFAGLNYITCLLTLQRNVVLTSITMPTNGLNYKFTGKQCSTRTCQEMNVSYRGLVKILISNPVTKIVLWYTACTVENSLPVYALAMQPAMITS